jgi:hypothetical protein
VGARPEDLGLPPSADIDDLSFDAVEVANDLDADSFGGDFAEWLTLVDNGHGAAATGSSDSHGASRYAGVSRTYVWVGEGNDDPASVDPAAINAAIKARHVVVAQGAFVTAGIVAPGVAEPSLPGDLVDLSGETTATIRIDVQAAPWMPVGQIVIYAGVQVARTINLDPGDTAVDRYQNDVTLDLPAAGDVLFVVRVNAAGRADPVLGDPVASFTNPLLVDADGDGVWTPPAAARRGGAPVERRARSWVE